MILLLLGCAPPTIDSGLGEPNPTYEADIAPMLEAHCVSCHARGDRIAGGVDVSDYRTARATRVTSVCTSITPAVMDQFADVLVPLGGDAAGPCADLDLFSMPPGAATHLDLHDQVTYARWVSLGAPER